MGQQIVIYSETFSGQQANIIFTPVNSNNSYSLGIQVIPFTFDTDTINSSLNVYGKYSIDIIESNCNYILNVT